MDVITAIGLIGFFGSFVSIIVLTISGNIFQKHQMAFKLFVVKDKLHRHFDDIEYTPIRSLKDVTSVTEFMTRKKQRKLNGLSTGEVMRSEFIPIGHTQESLNFIEGNIGGVPFIGSDFTAKKVHDARQASQNTRVSFRGRVFIFELVHPIKSPVFMLEKYKPYDTEAYTKIQTRNPRFNKKFTVYAKNDYTVNLLLNQTMIENILPLEKQYRGKLCLSVINQHLYVAWNTRKAAFSIRYFMPIGKKFFTRLKDDLSILYALVENLKLSSNLFDDKDNYLIDPIPRIKNLQKNAYS